MREMNLYFRTREERNYGKELSGYLQLYVIKVADTSQHYKTNHLTS